MSCLTRIVGTFLGALDAVAPSMGFAVDATIQIVNSRCHRHVLADHILGNLGGYKYWRRHNVANDTFDILRIASICANETTIASGRYKVLGRFLKVGGNPVNQDHCECWISRGIGVPASEAFQM
ncbi:hypothetical protein BKA62DRAFT_673202 [Auriculariales sp. MPI-PUGE-AT-0066]|nr:hypothetical protein BKA62DRAFT_673202 [Auriculariales sp. MPI-PUGE-AT-0066]